VLDQVLGPLALLAVGGGNAGCAVRVIGQVAGRRWIGHRDELCTQALCTACCMLRANSVLCSQQRRLRGGQDTGQDW
jgi:hypothetical protein